MLEQVGAPAEVVARMEEACAAKVSAMGMGMGMGGSCSIGEDPALDQFMEAYCEMLTKYHQELSKPFNEAMLFLSRIDSQFKALSLSPPPHHSGNISLTLSSSVSLLLGFLLHLYFLCPSK